MAIESGKSFSLMLEQYADCLPPEYIRQWRDPGAIWLEKTAPSLVFLSADISVPSFMWQRRIAYTSLKGFRVALSLRKNSTRNYFIFRIRVLRIFVLRTRED